MIRRKGILKIITVVLAVLLLAVFFAGCGEYTPPAGTGGGTVVDPNPGGDPNPPTEPAADGFTAKLTHYDGTSFTSNDYDLITRLQAQWTEITDGRPKVYRASFNEKGVANAGKLDGDFNVTLVLTADFQELYTYDPNPAPEERRDELKATNNKKEVSIPLYKIKDYGRSGEMFIGGENVAYTQMNETGAYKYTFQSREDKHFFFYVPRISGEYSFMTLMDVTADEVNPIVDLHYGIPGHYVNPTPALTQDDGGAEGKYTKNVWMKYRISKDETGGSAGMIINLYSESEKPTAYPLTVYFLFERDGEFSRPTTTSVTVPATENFNRTPARPSGTFTFVGEHDPVNDVENTYHVLDERKVRYNNPATGGDGYYYYLNPETNDFFRDGGGNVSAQYRLYAAITLPVPVLAAGSGQSSTATLAYGEYAQANYRYMVGEDGTPKNYLEFIMSGYAVAARLPKNGGAYPVTAELQQFLQDLCISQRYFNDGNGWAEGSGSGGPGYNSDEDSQWLFACGVYIN